MSLFSCALSELELYCVHKRAADDGGANKGEHMILDFGIGCNCVETCDHAETPARCSVERSDDGASLVVIVLEDDSDGAAEDPVILRKLTWTEWDAVVPVDSALAWIQPEEFDQIRAVGVVRTFRVPIVDCDGPGFRELSIDWDGECFAAEGSTFGPGEDLCFEDFDFTPTPEMTAWMREVSNG